MSKAKPSPKSDERVRMYFRVDPRTRARFKAVAQLNQETTERRLERLMSEDIARHLASAAS